jgi:hypothetical protein
MKLLKRLVVGLLLIFIFVSCTPHHGDRHMINDNTSHMVDDGDTHMEYMHRQHDWHRNGHMRGWDCY